MFRFRSGSAVIGAAGLALAIVAAGCGSSSTKTSSSPTTGGSANTVPAKYASGLNVAMDATYPPDEFVQNGQIVGFDADLANAIGKVLGVKMNLVSATFDTIIPGLLSGKFDLGNSSFTDTKAREQQVDFVDYFTAGEGFYVKADSKQSFDGVASLCGHSVAVESGTTEESDATTQGKSCSVNVLHFSDQNQANLAVSSGRADVGFLDSQVAAYVVHISNGQFKLTGTPFSNAPYGLAVPKASGLLQPILQAVKKLISNGQYGQILAKWGVQQGTVSTPQVNGATS